MNTFYHYNAILSVALNVTIQSDVSVMNLSICGEHYILKFYAPGSLCALILCFDFSVLPQCDALQCEYHLPLKYHFVCGT